MRGRGQGGLCTLCGDEERKDSPGGRREGGQQGCSSESTEKVRPLIVINEIISELPIVVHLFFLKF